MSKHATTSCGSIFVLWQTIKKSIMRIARWSFIIKNIKVRFKRETLHLYFDCSIYRKTEVISTIKNKIVLSMFQINKKKSQNINKMISGFPLSQKMLPYTRLWKYRRGPCWNILIEGKIFRESIEMFKKWENCLTTNNKHLLHKFKWISIISL